MSKRILLLLAVLVLPITLLQASAPAALEEPTVRFAAAGDFSASTRASQVLNTIDGLDTDLTLAVGDLSYGTTGAEQSWCDFVTARVGAGYPFELLAGNHESNGQNGNINDFSACLPNQLPGVVGTYGRQWYVDVPAVDPLVRYVMISPALPFPDGTYTYGAGSPRYQWTAAAIDGARTAGVPWVVVGMHKPCLSVGQYTCDPGADLMNLLVQKKVDLVLTGHEHLYQRTKQLSHGTGCTAIAPGSYDPDCVADADDALIAGRGTVMTTVGTGGVELRDVTATDIEAPYFAAYSGANFEPTYGALEVTASADVLSARFVAADAGFLDDAFTITKPTGNQLPIASFTEIVDGLGVSVDGSGSTDPDGSIASYSWNWGDGQPAGSGATASHTYAAAGTYTVTLTVTDNQGGTDSVSRSVSVSEAGVIAADEFGRTLTGGWGAADLGGSWVLRGSSSYFSVGGGVGAIRMTAAGSGPWTYLDSVASTATDTAVTMATDKAATGSGTYLTLIGREISGVGAYRAVARLQAGGAVSLAMSRRTAAGAVTAIGPTVTVSGLSYAVGDRLRLRLVVSGSGTTALKAKIWKVGQPEPAAWLVTGSDATSGYQAPGTVGVMTYLSSNATNAPVVANFDALSVTVAP
jgi:PKD repeat protein